MPRHEENYRFRDYASREDRGTHRDPMHGTRTPGWSHDNDHDDRERYAGRMHGGRYDQQDDGPPRWSGARSRQDDDRHVSYRGDRAGPHDNAYASGRGESGRYESEYGYRGGPSGRDNFEQDDMSSGGVAGGERRYGYGRSHGGDMYRGGSHDDLNSQLGGRVSQGDRRGMGSGYGIAASGHEHHGGKGPKGYTRSDDRIREDVCDCLTDDPMLDAGDIEVQVKNGEVTLSGTVSDRLAKRHAEDMIERVSGVKHLQNSLRVKDQNSNGGGGAQSGAKGAQAGKPSSM